MMALTQYARDAVIAWLGVDDMRVPAPVFIGDTVHLEAEVVELRETKKPEQGYCRMRYDVFNQRDELAMTFDMKFLMHRRVAN